MNIQTILVPVDFSTCSLLVTRQAAGLAARLGARLVLLHVVELPAGLGPSTRIGGVDVPVADYVQSDAEAQLGPFLESARALGVAAEAQVALGPVVPTIVAMTEKTASDLVIIGTHGRTGLARLVLGSVAEGVAHQSHVPVMLVRREARPECARASCEWCPHEGRSAAEERVAGESEG